MSIIGVIRNLFLRLHRFIGIRGGGQCGGIFIYLGTARRGARPAHGCVAGWGYREIVWREKEGAFLRESAGVRVRGVTSAKPRNTFRTYVYYLRVVFGRRCHRYNVVHYRFLVWPLAIPLYQ